MHDKHNFPDIDSALSSIKMFAEKHNMLPDDVSNFFSVGMLASHILVPHMLNETEAPDSESGQANH